MISRSVESVPLPIDDAFDLLKRLALPDGSPPNFTMSGGEDEELQRREQEHIRALSQSFKRPQMSTENPEISTINPLSPGFFAGHAHERLTDRERTVDENEEREVRSRITEAMQPYIDSRGNYKMNAPKHIAIRTHILSGHRQPDESYSKSNGDSIVGIVRPHPKNKLKPRLETSMLRRTEFSHAPQPFKPAALRVDKVVNAHGMSKKGLKRMMARRKAMAKGDPIGIAFQLLKNYPDEDPFSLTNHEDEGFQRLKAAYDANPESVEETWEYTSMEQCPHAHHGANVLGTMQDETGRCLYCGFHEDPEESRKENEEIMQNYRNRMGIKPEALINEEEDMDDWDKMKYTGEPMDISFQLLKERKSPEAMRRKKEYDTKYESSPERVKYREELNRERKRRGIYGSHNHMDVSHTQGGRLTLEGEHANRARHFKNRGTLRRVRVR